MPLIDIPDDQISVDPIGGDPDTPTNSLVQAWLCEATKAIEMKDWRKAGNAYHNLALTMFQRKLPLRAAMDCFDAAMRIYHYGREYRLLSVAMVNRANISLEADPGLGFQEMDAALAEIRQHGDRNDVSLCLAACAKTLIRCKEPSRARAILEEARKYQEEGKQIGPLAKTFLLLARVSDEEENAAEYLEKSAALASQVGDSETWFLALSYRCGKLMDQNRFAEALPYLQKIVGYPTASKEMEAGNRHLLGIALYRLGYPREATSQWSIAEKAFLLENNYLAYARVIAAIGSAHAELIRNASSKLGGTREIKKFYASLAERMEIDLSIGGDKLSLSTSDAPELLLEALLSEDDDEVATSLIFMHVEQAGLDFFNAWFARLTYAHSCGDSEAFIILVTLGRYIVTMQKQIYAFVDVPPDDERGGASSVLEAARNLQVEGASLLNRGHDKDAIVLLRRAMEMFRGAGEVDGAARCLIDVGVALNNLGRLDEAAEAADSAAGSFALVANYPLQCQSLSFLAVVNVARKRYEEALTGLDGAIALGEKSGSILLTSSLMLRKARLLYNLGRQEEVAHSLLEASVEKLLHVDDFDEYLSIGDDLSELYVTATEKMRSVLRGNIERILMRSRVGLHHAALLYGKACGAMEAKEWIQAESYLSEALRLLGNLGHLPLQGMTRVQLAIVYSWRGRRSEADAALAEAEPMLRAANNAPVLRDFLVTKAFFASSRNDPDTVISAYEELNEKYREGFAGEILVDVLSYVVDSLIFAGRVPEAIEYADRLKTVAFNILQQTDLPPDAAIEAAIAIGDLAKRHDFGIDLTEAESAIRGAMEYAKKVSDGDLLRLIVRLGIVLRAKGEADLAIDEELEGISLAEKRNDDQLKCLLANAATGLYEVGRLAESEQLFLYALRLGEAARDLNFLTQIGPKISLLYSTLGRRDLARQYAESSIAMAREIGNRESEAFALSRIAGMAIEAGDWQTAEASCQAGLGLGIGISDDVRSELLSTLAFMRLHQKRFDEAQEAIGEAIWVGKHHPVEQAMLLGYGGLIAFCLDSPARAVEQFHLALSLFDPQSHPDLRSWISGYLGAALWALGDLDGAREAYTAAVQYHGKLYGEIPTEGDRLGFARRQGDTAHQLVVLLIQQGDGVCAFEALEESKARTFRQRLARVSAPLPSSVPAEIRDEDARIRQELRDIEAALGRAEGAGQKEKLYRSLGEKMKSYDGLVQRVGAIAPEMARLRAGNAVTFSETVSLLSM